MMNKYLQQGHKFYYCGEQSRAAHYYQAIVKRTDNVVEEERSCALYMLSWIQVNQARAAKTLAELRQYYYQAQLFLQLIQQQFYPQQFDLPIMEAAILRELKWGYNSIVYNR